MRSGHTQRNAPTVQAIQNANAANSGANMIASHNCQLTRTYFGPNLDCQQECRLASDYKEEM